MGAPHVLGAGSTVQGRHSQWRFLCYPLFQDLDPTNATDKITLFIMKSRCLVRTDATFKYITRPMEPVNNKENLYSCSAENGTLSNQQIGNSGSQGGVYTSPMVWLFNLKALLQSASYQLNCCSNPKELLDGTPRCRIVMSRFSTLQNSQFFQVFPANFLQMRLKRFFKRLLLGGGRNERNDSTCVNPHQKEKDMRGQIILMV